MYCQAQQFYKWLLIMWNRSLGRIALIVLSSTVALVSVACSPGESVKSSQVSTNAVATSPSSTPSPVASSNSELAPSPTPPTQPAKPASDTYEKAIDAAASASTIAQTAQSQEDWEVVANRWEDAVKFLKAVPDANPNKAKVKTKLTEYQKNLAYAKLQASPPPTNRVKLPNVIFTNQPSFKTAIKYRLHGIPVIDVTFNGKKFEMLFDTGASHTLITPYMASILTLPLVGKSVASTANGDAEFYVGLVKSMQVGSAVAQNVPVGIGAPDLDIGLFGQDFYKGYEVSVRQDVIEFRRR